MEKTEVEELKSKARRWGLQTVLFTMNIRAHELGKVENDVQFMKAARAEAEKTTRKLWRAARAACSKPFKPSEFVLLFTRNVLDWCNMHRKGSGISW